MRIVGFSLSEMPVSASSKVEPPALRRMCETKCGGIASPLTGSIWNPELFGWRMLICKALSLSAERSRISPSLPPPAALGGAEQPPLALTHVLRISSEPSVISTTARTDVKRSMRTRRSIWSTGTPGSSCMVTASGDGLLSMMRRICLTLPAAAPPNFTVTGVADGSGVLPGAAMLIRFSSTSPMSRFA